mmetsp:Transcript_58490/g.166352  ORF Transcript_58490/g.166352 Transcript_58490/m.166352 type:complete len:107 (+) Transcript_58490:84-404(+)|eukprot:CAMPEP_0168376774 /NCGR_PEP_ID=MMETSP0228-20121227/10489_1 /TAXON_ID=133427 /ORGANISM="Protoceratium reticulatum, Strain CCCM 535 (=CCMP 1889)" /LENGTH=106 /DNA_ID=CAMNT_0008389761 /DNA_START=57 /DNA_END=377 /DNA_ORIENTATION=+
MVAGLIARLAGSAVKGVLKSSVKQAAKNSATLTTRGAGPSGKATVHNVQHSSRKAAEQAARSAGQGKPMHHSSGPGGGGHFHATDKAGNKITGGQAGGVHHGYGKQ